MHGDICKSVYCHWDGYPEHNGAILQAHYDSAKANQLVALGDLSSLGPEIGQAHPFSPYGSDEDKATYEAAREAGWSTFYGRDRGETDVSWSADHTFEDFFDRVEGPGCEWYYVMRDGVWYCGNTYESSPLYKKLTPLTEVLESVKEAV
jgi:hypothetical protein